MPTMRLFQAVSALFLGGILLVDLAGALAVADLSTAGPSRRLGGITIETQGEPVRIVRRHLDCTAAPPPITSESCRLTIAGDVLRVEVTHHPDRHGSFSDCRVSHRGATFGCWATTYTVTGPPHAVVAGLSLPDGVMQSLRRQHFLASQWEAGWLDLARGMATVLAVGVALVVIAWVTGHGLRQLALAVASGAGTFALAYGAVVMFLLVTGFVD